MFFQWEIMMNSDFRTFFLPDSDRKKRIKVLLLYSVELQKSMIIFVLQLQQWDLCRWRQLVSMWMCSGVRWPRLQDQWVLTFDPLTFPPSIPPLICWPLLFQVSVLSITLFLHLPSFIFCLALHLSSYFCSVSSCLSSFELKFVLHPVSVPLICLLDQIGKDRTLWISS